MKKILLVDDNLVTRTNLADLLRLDGHEVRFAGNGLEALGLLAEAPADVVIVDLLMPVMSGLEFVAKVRSNRIWDDIPVVVLTAAAEDEIATVAAFPHVQVLRKPLEPAFLRSYLAGKVGAA